MADGVTYEEDKRITAQYAKAESKIKELLSNACRRYRMK